MWATHQGHAKCVHVLVGAGASVLAKDGVGKTAGNLAQDAGNATVIKLLPRANEQLYTSAGRYPRLLVGCIAALLSFTLSALHCGRQWGREIGGALAQEWGQ